MRMIKTSVSKMVSFISDILSYSRIAKHKHTKSKVNIKTMVDGIIQTLNPPSTYKIYVQEDLPEVFANSLEIFQIFSNLLSNAFKYMNRPDGQIEVYYNVLDKNYLFTVKDNGPGIEADYKEKIFDMFETIPAQRTKDSTGIGLATIKQLIQDNGGKIWVDSIPGKGAAFKFTLPIEE
jgi:two-component system, LuxR family, sensor kinase FixL